MRKDEEHCKMAFDTFLARHFKTANIEWETGDEPPDYFLQLCEERYAVEVTSIMETTTLGSNDITHIEIDKSIRNFIKQIEKVAIEDNYLRGAYIVKYKPIIDLGKQKQAISTRIKDYLVQTQSVSSAPEELIAGRGHQGWYIHKPHSNKDYLTVFTMDVKWHGEAENDLITLINKAVVDKVKKLAKIPLPKILLIYDRFAWIDACEWNKYTPKIDHIDNFHTVFLVSDKSTNSVLCSINRLWLNN